MRSKWEWIRDACKELGYNEAAGIADEIETLLKDIYGNTKTIAWMREYIGVKERYLVSINIWIVASSMEYCVACMEEELCENCRFRKRAGGCNSKGSLYNRFFDALHREDERRA